MFVSIYCILCHFQRFMVLNATLWLTVTHTVHVKVMDQSWHTGPNDSVLHFELVFVYCSYQIGKLVVVVH